VQKIGRDSEFFEKNLTEPYKKQPKDILEDDGKMEWAGRNTNRMCALTFSMSFSR